MTLRPAVPADVDAWQAAFASVAAEGRWIGAEAPVDDFAPRVFEGHVQRDESLFLLADDDGDVVGWITAERDDVGDAELGMAIVDGYRRQGIGSAMLGAVADWAESAGISRLHLDVFPSNDPAIALYRKWGFIEVDRRVGAWPRRNGERWDLLVMERRSIRPT